MATEENKKEKLEEDKKKDTAQEKTEGTGYVPPAPETPSARNTRQHDSPITSRTPRGKK